MIHSRWSGGDLIFYDGTQDIMTVKDDADGIIFGEDDEGVDVKFYGDAASAYMLWDADTDDLVFEGGAGIAFDDGDISLGDADYINFGDTLDITMRWTTGSVFEVLPLAAGSDMYLGSTSLPLDIVNYGNITYRAPAAQTSTGANITLTSTSNRIQFVANATTGDSPVLLPSASTSSAAGDQFIIFQTSTGGGSVIVYDSTTGGTTVATIAETEGALMISNGTVWRAIVGPET